MARNDVVRGRRKSTTHAPVLEFEDPTCKCQGNVSDLSIVVTTPRDMKRTERLFAIAEHLRTRRTGVTAESLAERFGVSVRTIYRDLDSLRAAHLPLNADSGPGGGYALSASYNLPPVNFSVAEASILIAAVEWIDRFRLLPFTGVLSDAAAKVRSALPATVRRTVHERAERLAFVGVPQHAVPQSVRRAVEQAWFEDLPLRIRYLKKGNYEEVRRVHIRSIVVDRFETRLNVRDLDKQADRQFIMHFILAAEVEEPV